MLAQLEQDWVVANGVAPDDRLPPTSLALDWFSIEQGAQPAWMRQKVADPAMAAGFNMLNGSPQ